MLDTDTNLDTPASEDLLAAIGLGAHTIREILTEAVPAPTDREGE